MEPEYKRFVIYGTDTCKYCVQAERELITCGYEYDTFNVKSDVIYPLFKGMGLTTVPHVFVMDPVVNQWKHIGGYESLKEYLEDEL